MGNVVFVFRFFSISLYLSLYGTRDRSMYVGELDLVECIFLLSLSISFFICILFPLSVLLMKLSINLSS